MDDCLKHYPSNLYLGSLVSIFNNITVKSVVGFLVQGISFVGIRDVYANLLQSPVALVSVIAFLIAMDFISGILKAIRNDKFSPRMLRATVVKVIEYVIFLSSITAVSNAFSEHSEFAQMMMPHLELSAYFIVTVIELNSIVENLGIAGIGKAWGSLKVKYNLKKFINGNDNKE